jgi:hypothetical protein
MAGDGRVGELMMIMHSSRVGVGVVRVGGEFIHR